MPNVLHLPQNPNSGEQRRGRGNPEFRGPVKQRNDILRTIVARFTEAVGKEDFRIIRDAELAKQPATTDTVRQVAQTILTPATPNLAVVPDTAPAPITAVPESRLEPVYDPAAHADEARRQIFELQNGTTQDAASAQGGRLSQAAIGTYVQQHGREGFDLIASANPVTAPDALDQQFQTLGYNQIESTEDGIDRQYRELVERSYDNVSAQ